MGEKLSKATYDSRKIEPKSRVFSGSTKTKTSPIFSLNLKIREFPTLKAGPRIQQEGTSSRLHRECPRYIKLGK